LVPWLASLGEHAVIGWLRLQDIYLIGPKVASWAMRDISFMVDYVSDIRSNGFSYRQKRDTRWFASLTVETLACFIPIDAWVFKYARRAGALSPRSVRNGLAGIQDSPVEHRRAAMEIVRFARRRRYDPRDVDSFWYQFGSGAVDGEGHEIS